ncbi:hypothetical protein [Microvirga pakistanensis]|uniref:hypothetical protein n=1 Tax=Microvirga pakistanensis TaxID=1682650 RepID=UPI00106CF804|nr:hypothetical protein [Microvirga pakistanensis]
MFVIYRPPNNAPEVGFRLLIVAAVLGGIHFLFHAIGNRDYPVFNFCLTITIMGLVLMFPISAAFAFLPRWGAVVATITMLIIAWVVLDWFLLRNGPTMWLRYYTRLIMLHAREAPSFMTASVTGGQG